MDPTHSQNLQSLERRLKALLAFRAAVQMTTVWLFVWSIIVLAARISGMHQTGWLAIGFAGIAPVSLFAAWYSRRQLPSASRIRASYDLFNRCGGVVMS